ncbi:plasmid stabilization protein [Aliidiomarina sedimenti]|uniref:Plasmid stabilization protein n=1 Tax=Aliidiomarina sedimenti TaxID=1933879 RepID=A0ABY0C1Y3_9GAMM|nr:type II toxin-antitoxin system RelE/ParE family toxin [Aliidiomarina sedimenti]RUO31648.1 plasmid stabilization protein [Aliidiomarina sedimenti]
MKLVYTDNAIGDLKCLRAFIGAHDGAAANRIAAELIARIALLPDFPKLGTPVQMAPVPENIRDMVFGKYVVRYSLHTNTIIILRVWHGLENERRSFSSE